MFRLDQNQQYVLFERSARQSLAWIKEEGNLLTLKGLDKLLPLPLTRPSEKALCVDVHRFYLHFFLRYAKKSIQIIIIR